MLWLAVHTVRVVVYREHRCARQTCAPRRTTPCSCPPHHPTPTRPSRSACLVGLARGVRTCGRLQRRGARPRECWRRPGRHAALARLAGRGAQRTSLAALSTYWSAFGPGIADHRSRSTAGKGAYKAVVSAVLWVDVWPDVAVQSARAARGHARPSCERARMLFTHTQSHLWRHDSGSCRRYSCDTVRCARERVRAWADARAAHLAMSGAVRRVAGRTSEPSARPCALTPTPRPPKTC